LSVFRIFVGYQTPQNQLVNYELETLYSLIFIELEMSDPDAIDQWESKLKQEFDRIKRAFINTVFGIGSEQKIERYIQQHQAELTRMLDELTRSYSADRAKRQVFQVLFYKAHKIIEELLDFVEKHFSRYFNVDAKIPDSYKEIVAKDFRKKVRRMEKVLESFELDQKVQAILLAPSRRISTKRPLTYRELMYLKTLQEQLFELPNVEWPEQDKRMHILLTMIYINFNSYKFFACCVAHLTSMYQNEDTLVGQIDKLAWLSKLINQTQQKPGVAYKLGRDSLKSSLLQWIHEEMAFLEKRHQLTLNLPINKAEELSDFKLNTSLSVAQLAYLTRILLEEKILLNSNQREVLKFLARFVRTKKAENVSAESLRTRYYNVDTSTKEAVKDSIIRLLNNVRKVT